MSQRRRCGRPATDGRGLLATNLDLVRWALCVATGDEASGDCIEAYIRGEHTVRLVPKGSPCALPNGRDGGYNALTWVVDRDAILAAIFARDPLNLSNPASLAIVAADLVFGDPDIWWCTMSGLPLDRSSRMVAVGSAADKDCGVLTLAASLLHEMTHLCGRTFVGEKELTCDASYLTANYFVWGASARFPTATASRCCQWSEGLYAVPSPGHEPMSGNFKNNPSCLDEDLAEADPPTWAGPGVSGPFRPRGGETPELVPTPFDDPPDDPHIQFEDLDPQLSDSRPVNLLLATADSVQAVGQQGVEIDW